MTGMGADNPEDHEARQAPSGINDRNVRLKRIKQMAEEQKTGALAAFLGGGDNLPATKDEIAAALLASARDGSTGSGDVLFMSFSGQGANYRGWTVGRDKNKPDPDAVYVIDPYSTMEGWTCWKGGGVAEKREWSVFQRATKAVSESMLPDHGPYADGDGWQFMMGLAMFDVDNPGQKIVFTTTSKSGKNALADLVSEIGNRIIGDEPDTPVVMLSDEAFVSQGKKNGKPKFLVEGWVSRSEVEAFLGAGDDADLETLLSGGYQPEDEAPEAEPAEEAPKPSRRARRAAA